MNLEVDVLGQQGSELYLPVSEEIQADAREIFDRLIELAQIGNRNFPNDAIPGVSYTLWIKGEVAGSIQSPFVYEYEEIDEIEVSSSDLFTVAEVDEELLNDYDLQLLLELDDEGKIVARIGYSETDEHLDRENDILWELEKDGAESDPDYNFEPHERISGSKAFQPSKEFMDRLRNLLFDETLEVGDPWGLSTYPSEGYGVADLDS